MSDKNTTDTQEKTPPILNDIYYDEKKESVDISSLFLLSQIRVFRKLFKQSTKDIFHKWKKTVFLSIYPKIKLLKLYRPFNSEIKKVKKNKPIILSNYQPIENYTTLNLSDFDETQRVISPVFDFQHPKKQKFVFFRRLSFSLVKIGVSFLVLILSLFLYGITTKTYIEKTFQGIQTLDIKNFSLLKSNLQNIQSDLKISYILIQPLLGLNLIVQNSSIDNLGKIIPAGRDMLQFSLYFFDIYDGVNAMVKEKWINEIMFSQLIDNIEPILINMNQNLSSAIDSLKTVGDFSDENINFQFKKYVNQVYYFWDYFHTIMDNLSVIKDILWHNEKKTYFIIFQNNDEIRPTGWFMGSVGILELFRWKIANFETKDIYAIEWDLKDFATKNGVAFEQSAPEGLNKISKTFWLRDANYYPTIEESSLKIQEFLKNSEYKIDGIVYINQNLILNILKKIGPIYYDAVKRDITYDNFSTLFSTLVEAKITKTHTLATPKQILFDFITIFFDKIKSIEDYKFFVELFIESIEKKDVSIYFFNTKENDFLKQIGLEKSYDYLSFFDFNYPVFTSISGNKSDRYISRNFEKTYSIQENCDISTSLKITQKHGFNINEEVYIKTLLYDMDALGQVDINTLLDIQWKWLNKQYIRVLIPKNAQVIQNKNITITDFPEYKEVSFYLDTNTFFESNSRFEYTIPNPECKNYTYNFIKQPGIKNYHIDIINNWNLQQSLYTETDFTFND